MSHLVTIESKVHDAAAITAACQRLKIDAPTWGAATLYSGEVNGLLVKFPGWVYPAVIDPLTGSVSYDNFSGAWGDQVHLEKFLQMYVVEKAKLEARKRGHAVSEQMLTDGSIRLHIIERA